MLSFGFKGLFSTQDGHAVRSFRPEDDEEKALSDHVAALARAGFLPAYVYCDHCNHFTLHTTVETAYAEYNGAIACHKCSSACWIEITSEAAQSFRNKGAILRSGIICPLETDGIYMSEVFQLPGGEPMMAIIRFLSKTKAVTLFSEFRPEEVWEELNEETYPILSCRRNHDRIDFGPAMFFERAPECRGFHNGDAIVLEHPSLSSHLSLWFVSADRLRSMKAARL